MGDDALWLGIESIEGPDVPTINVFRKSGEAFELVRIIDGAEAISLYETLTKGEDEKCQK